MDLFGYALYSSWKGIPAPPCAYERDDGSRAPCNIGDYFTVSAEDKQALRLARGRTLDIGCGAGSHALLLQRKGIEVLCIDTSSLALQVCRGRGCKRCRQMNIFRHKLHPSSFDTILLMGTNVGLAGTLDRCKRLFRICSELAKPGARLIVTSKDVRTRTNRQQVRYHRSNLEAGRFIGERRIRFTYGRKTGNWFKWIFIDPVTLRTTAHASGWEVESIINAQRGRYSAVLHLASLTQRTLR
ncbi:MAG: class I SAM-dependent methyltransferase [Nanoarchaeota archaeon]|nr:class I SAM-dependent methyltransferase [Nanoarchaeota archaeon]